MSKKNICLLVNPYAGNSCTIKSLKKVEKELRNLSLNYRTIITSDIEHAQMLAKEASVNGEYIVVLGGDGSVSAVAETIMNHNGVLALLPSGRGNDFARMLNYPINPIAACRILADGAEAMIDIGKVNNHLFLTICSLGFDSIVNKIANRTSLVTGRTVYLYAGLRAILTFKPIEFKVTIDGNEFEHIGHTIAVANTQYYGGGMRLAPNASAQDGLLDVVMIGQIPKHRMFINIPRIYKGNHINEPGFKIIQGRNIKIETDYQYTIVADGDFISPPPAEIVAVPKALRVIVPSGFHQG
jgi:YegS/Rv2252/BmrU family lipid kinase